MLDDNILSSTNLKIITRDTVVLGGWGWEEGTLTIVTYIKAIWVCADVKGMVSENNKSAIE